HPADHAPIAVEVGERVRLGERDTTWPAFRLVTKQDGGKGWVPATCFGPVPGGGPDDAVATTRYDTHEIAPAPGEEVTVLELDEPSGWAWCRDARGAQGWLPLSVLDLPG
ncbi:MAG: peptide-binding protein, partial [Candidatus Dormibacteraeota bacterium]|nr:peptide-binding protein [Candidatus Dormibacteraeota bacterium]